MIVSSLAHIVNINQRCRAGYDLILMMPSSPDATTKLDLTFARGNEQSFIESVLILVPSRGRGRAVDELF